MTEVRTLVGKKTLATSVVCLRSLTAAVAEPMTLIVHEDGTLDDGDREQLRTVGDRVELVPRAAVDDRVRAALAKHPKCLAARDTNPLFLKLFDIALLAGPRLAYCDSDVLFVRRVKGLFAPPNPAARLTFMSDLKHAYSVRPWNVWPVGPVKLMGRVNTGLLVWERPEPDLDLVEWLFGRLATDRGFVTRPFWAEQTAWAAWAAGGAWLWDDRQVALADPAMTRPTAETVAIHFVSTYRHHLTTYQGRPLPDDPPATVTARPARRLTAAGMLRSDVVARLGW